MNLIASCVCRGTQATVPDHCWLLSSAMFKSLALKKSENAQHPNLSTCGLSPSDGNSSIWFGGYHPRKHRQSGSSTFDHRFDLSRCNWVANFSTSFYFPSSAPLGCGMMAFKSTDCSCALLHRVLFSKPIASCEGVCTTESWPDSWSVSDKSCKLKSAFVRKKKTKLKIRISDKAEIWSFVHGRHIL